MNDKHHKKARIRAMSLLRYRYGDDVVKGWVHLHCVALSEDAYDDEWCLTKEGHFRVITREDVRSGYGYWTSGSGETEAWVRRNANQMHTILWEMADRLGMTVWEFIDKHDELTDDASQLLVDLLGDDLCETHDIPRTIGWLIGNEITNSYTEISYELDIGEE